MALDAYPLQNEDLFVTLSCLIRFSLIIVSLWSAEAKELSALIYDGSSQHTWLRILPNFCLILNRLFLFRL
jgi:hypothetical protein